MKVIHKLSGLDPDSRTALCQECGPVSVVSTGNNKFLCAVKKAENRKKYRKPGNWQVKKRQYKFEGGNFYLSDEEREALLDAKLCAICDTEKATCIDHCHSTGVIRGVLCTHCNWLLGHAKDNPETLASAIDYLQA